MRGEDAPRTVRGARDLLSVGLQYGNAFLRGFQAAALKPADFFGDDDVLYLMEDMATGEIRLSILWEWLHKGAPFTQDDPETGLRAGDTLTPELFARLLDEEHAKLLAADGRDVHDDSKATTLPVARAIVEAYVPARGEARLVHRPAQPEPGQRGSAGRPRAGGGVPGGHRARRHAPDREPRLRGRDGGPTMTQREPVATRNLDGYGNAELPWSRARDALAEATGADITWFLGTVRPDGDRTPPVSARPSRMTSCSS